MIRVVLPAHLRTLAQVDGEVQRRRRGPVTPARGARRARGRATRCCAARSATGHRQRRAFVRFFACEEDLSHEPPTRRCPEPVARGAEPFLVVGAMAGG